MTSFGKGGNSAAMKTNMALRHLATWVLCVGVLVLPQSVWAWGKTGHRIVGEIAERHLTAQAKGYVRFVLAGQSLAEESVWADVIRSDENFSFQDPWHYVTVPEKLQYKSTKKAKGGDVIRASKEQEKVLRNPKSTLTDQRYALRLLAHFLSDLHQPLHVGNGKDQGGNLCLVRYFKEPTNLHSVWDTHMIERENPSYKSFADAIDFVDAQREVQMAKGDYESWARESQLIRPSVYPKPENRNYCVASRAHVASVSEDQMPSLYYDYDFTFLPIVKERLLRAGIRLAAVINEVVKSHEARVR